MLYVSTYVVLLLTLQLLSILQETPYAWLWLAVWGLLFVLLWLWRGKLSYPQDHPHVVQRRRIFYAFFAGLLFLIFTHIYFQAVVADHRHSEIANLFAHERGLTAEDALSMNGRVDSDVVIDGDRIRFTLEVQAIAQHKLAQPEKVILTRYADDLTERDAYHTLVRGQLWSGMVSLSQPQPARNPGAFDYREYLYRQGIQWTGQVVSPQWNVAEQKTVIQRILRGLDDHRQRWLDQIESIFSAKTAPIVQAMIIGYRDGIQAELMTMYQDLGIIHLLAISGLHIGVILGTLYVLLGWLPITRERKYTIMFCFIPVYIYLCGAPVSVVRAGLMAMVVLLTLRLGRSKQALHGLYFVYVLTLVIDPYQLYHVGYQLSFGVTFALIAIYPAVRKSLAMFPERVQSVVGVALVAELASLPFIVYHFYQFSPLSLLLNIVLVPLYAAFYIPAAFLITLVSFILPEIVPLWAAIYENSLQWIHDRLADVHQWIWATLHVGFPGLWWFGLYMLVLFLWIWFVEKNSKKAWLCLGCLPFVLALPLVLPYLDQRAHMMMLDVGQAEAIVIELPHREEVLLIDVGDRLRFPEEEWRIGQNTFEAGQDVILPYLRYRGIRQIDKVIFSHGHYDHTAGLASLLGRIKIDSVWRSPVTPQTDHEARLIAHIQAHGIPVYTLGKDDQWQTQTAHFRVLFPERRDEEDRHVAQVHDVNLVLWNQIYETSFLWTGDVEAKGEQQMLEDYPLLEADVLKVAHHGSNTSTTQPWLARIQPQAALISVGENNMYRHPHREVTNRLHEAGVTVFRTDIHGGIRVTVSPERVVIRPTLQAEGEQIQ